MLLRIIAPWFVAGVVLRDDIVVEAAPILRYTVGWSEERLRSYAKRRRWNVGNLIGKETPTKQED